MNRLDKLTLGLLTVAMLIAAQIAPASAGNWAKDEKPCGRKCPQPSNQVVVWIDGKPVYESAYKGVGLWAVRPSDGPMPTAVIRSRSVIQSNYGTSVVDSTYRSYR